MAAKTNERSQRQRVVLNGDQPRAPAAQQLVGQALLRRVVLEAGAAAVLVR